jgi:3-deoxy-D-manno-octulosonate 8-phosphate phosphatase (KDO 8-P phosphatase)
VTHDQALLALRDLDPAAVISDVDGVLTDGSITFTSDGSKSRTFHIQDGMGVKLLLAAGVKIAWISASRDDGVIRTRGEMLGVQHIDVGAGDKGERLARACAAIGVKPDQCVYIGDDVNDLPAMKRCAFSACPSDARPEVRQRVSVVLDERGGRGAFRALADLVLNAKRLRDGLDEDQMERWAKEALA